MKKLVLMVISILIVLATMASISRFSNPNVKVTLVKTRFAQLPAWNRDHQGVALLAFQHSCQEILKRNPYTLFSNLAHAGTVGYWQQACLAADKISANDLPRARMFFETWFEPYRINDSYHRRSLFTGYYLPLLHGSLRPDQHYNVPIYALPNDLIKINLGLFKPALNGITLVAQQRNNQLYPYPARAEINAGAIIKSARVLLWADNPLDVFFAQIQGSALVELPDHQQLLISYAGTNGRPYTPIGNVLIANKVLTKKMVSMQTIRDWLTQHSNATDAVLNKNASYIFFSVTKASPAQGSEHVPLLPGRSIAVDNSVIPYGAPLWINTTAPQRNATVAVPLQRLLIAQDTGGAIKGTVRGDVYWGAGEEAAYIAGHMQSAGQLWILLPRQGVTR
ncbi:MAG: MltA domain-containing protein [Pseudomonadota bacterium]